MSNNCSSCDIEGRCTNGWRGSWSMEKGELKVKCVCWCHWPEEDKEDLRKILKKERVKHDS